MANPKNATERSRKYRKSIKRAGLKRFELSPPPHPDDVESIKEYAAKLAKERSS